MAIFTVLFAITSLLSAGFSAYQSIQQGKDRAGMASYNALIARQNADLALQKQELQKTQTRIAEKRQREENRKFLSAQRSLYGKAGVQMEGTPLLTLQDTAMEGELDALAIRYAGSIEEANIVAQGSAYRQEAQLAKMRGEGYSAAGYAGAGSELLSGISQFAGAFANKPKNAPKT